jgi:uncharacterized protein (DUF885 family)
MKRREFLSSAVALSVGSALASAARAGAVAPKVPEDAGMALRAREVYVAIFDDLLATSPQTATGLGLDTGPRAGLRSRLDDRSSAGRMSILAPLVRA